MGALALHYNTMMLRRLMIIMPSQYAYKGKGQRERFCLRQSPKLVRCPVVHLGLKKSLLWSARFRTLPPPFFGFPSNSIPTCLAHWVTNASKFWVDVTMRAHVVRYYLQLHYTSKLEVICDQTTSNVLVYNLQLPCKENKYDHWDFSSRSFKEAREKYQRHVRQDKEERQDRNKGGMRAKKWFGK